MLMNLTCRINGLTRFCRRHDISLRRKTHAAQKTPGELRQSIEEFHTSLIRERKRRTYALKDLANIGPDAPAFRS